MPLSGAAAAPPRRRRERKRAEREGRQRAPGGFRFLIAPNIAVARVRRLPSCATQAAADPDRAAPVTPDVMEQMQARSDEQLENERKYRSIAYSILGARAAERYDAQAARTWFEKAMVASTPPAGAHADPPHGRRVAGARRAPRRRPQDRGRAARPGGAVLAPAVRPARDGPDRAAARVEPAAARFAACWSCSAMHHRADRASGPASSS